VAEPVAATYSAASPLTQRPFILIIVIPPIINPTPAIIRKLTCSLKNKYPMTIVNVITIDCVCGSI